MNPANSSIDPFFTHAQKWQEEFIQLRKIILDCNLTETLKWGCPCYTYQQKNIVLIHGFKNYCALLLFKGALLNDLHGILIQQTPNVQSPRQIRFTHVQEIKQLAPVLKKYIHNAIEVEKAGKKVQHKTIADYAVPEEFELQLQNNPALKKAFNALTPGRQRQYLFYFAQAKQSATRTARVEKYIPQILNGKGLADVSRL
ncbi:YdeI/OmpD-associated family protein [Hydrotalea sp.]|uniref:YdeI/OmpD-associated family protein n=1 Tax=Hydrotalea sp. TaxID=2881279 RepID=UPI002612B706|nr:YdeI/OmpD-associated family protein [Hydrotalea sp.]